MFQILNRDLGRMLDLMSPSTLAALIHDIEELGTGADSSALEIERAAREALDANCGPDDAARYIAAALTDLATGHSMAGEARARAALAKVSH